LCLIGHKETLPLASIERVSWRIMVNAPVPEEDKTAFQVSMPARGQTPETAALAAGEGEAEPLDIVSDPQDAEIQAPDRKPDKSDPSGPAV